MKKNSHENKFKRECQDNFNLKMVLFLTELKDADTRLLEKKMFCVASLSLYKWLLDYLIF